jgi:hypothetical protein
VKNVEELNYHRVCPRHLLGKTENNHEYVIANILKGVRHWKINNKHNFDLHTVTVGDLQF